MTIMYPKKDTLCPCCSQLPFADCCQKALDDHAAATTPEQLMRSRYTAFVLREDTHILRSWHPRTRPQGLNHDEFPVVWMGLKVHSSSVAAPDFTSGTVEFTTLYLENGIMCELREKSTFLLEDGLWYYLRGDCSLNRSKLERNVSCPCGSGRKFKKCCLVKTS